MSVSPVRNRLNPPLVPLIPTEIRACGKRPRNSAATASVMGATVLEPSMRIAGESRGAVGWPTVPKAAAATRSHTTLRTIVSLLSIYFCRKYIHGRKALQGRFAVKFVTSRAIYRHVFL